MKPGNSAAEKELSQLLQAKAAFDSAMDLFKSNDFFKALDYLDKVVLVFSPACSEVNKYAMLSPFRIFVYFLC